MERTGPGTHTLLSVTMRIMTKRRPSILQAQVRRMAVGSSGLEELVKSNWEDFLVDIGCIFYFHTWFLLCPEHEKLPNMHIVSLKMGRKMIMCQVAPNAKVFKNMWDGVFVLKICRGSTWVIRVFLRTSMMKSVFFRCLVVRSGKKAWRVQWSLESFFPWWSLMYPDSFSHSVPQCIVGKQLLYSLEERQQLRRSTLNSMSVLSVFKLWVTWGRLRCCYLCADTSGFLKHCQVLVLAYEDRT